MFFSSKHGHLQIEVYTNADWADSLMDRGSMMGYCTLVGSNLVTLRTKILMVVTRYSAEAEFWVIAQGLCEVL